jgi:hypothetical protein
MVTGTMYKCPKCGKATQGCVADRPCLACTEIPSYPCRICGTKVVGVLHDLPCNGCRNKLMEQTIEVPEFSAWCGEFAERWNKHASWDNYCLVKDAWLNGFWKAREMIQKEYEALRASCDPDYLTHPRTGRPVEAYAVPADWQPSQVGEDPVTITIKSNQIGAGRE